MSFIYKKKKKIYVSTDINLATKIQQGRIKKYKEKIGPRELFQFPHFPMVMANPKGPLSHSFSTPLLIFLFYSQLFKRIVQISSFYNIY